MNHNQRDDNVHMQIGDVAEGTGLSLRTIRYYEEAGLVIPKTRTVGGFRLYSTADSERLKLVTRMKPLGFSLDEMRDLLQTLDELDQYSDEATHSALQERLERFAESVDERRELLDRQVLAARELAELLHKRSTPRVAGLREPDHKR